MAHARVYMEKERKSIGLDVTAVLDGSMENVFL